MMRVRKYSHLFCLHANVKERKVCLNVEFISFHCAEGRKGCQIVRKCSNEG